MNVAEMFLHNMRKEPCPAWVFCGNEWTDETKKRVEELFSKYVEYKQFPSFNYWKLLTDGKDWIIAMRFTWNGGALGGNWEKLEKDLAEYYSK